MDNTVLLVITSLLGGANLVFILKILFSDIRDLRQDVKDVSADIKRHLLWHLNGDTELR